MTTTDHGPTSWTPPSPHGPADRTAYRAEHSHDYGQTWYPGSLPRCTDPSHPTPAPCIAGDHEPNDAGTACYYCGLPAEPVDPQEAAEALYCAFVNHQDRDRWSEALAGAAVIARAVPTLARPNRSYPADMPAQLAAIARWHRADRIERDR